MAETSPAREAVVPNESHVFNRNIQVYVFGRPTNWSLKANPNARGRIALFANKHGIRTILAPKPDFSGRVCAKEELCELITNVLSPSEETDILRGADADGVEVCPGEGFFLASGDCLTLIVHDPIANRLVCAHAGRESLYDKGKLLGENPREHESVVDAIMARFSPEHRPRLKAFMVCGIAGKNFLHPRGKDERGILNARMAAHVTELWGEECFLNSGARGCLSLKHLIKAQLLKYGVDLDSIGSDTVDTYGDLTLNGEPRWWSNRRGDKTERNGVLVLFTK